jgi:hypothetical protein
MKPLKCALCEVTAEGETVEEWTKALHPHFVEAHADVMKALEEDTPEAKESLVKWMTENKARFAAA